MFTSFSNNKFKSENDYNKEINELLNCDSDGKKFEKISDHPLFDIIDGLPLSVVLLSSLKTDMSLVEIYELLKIIQQQFLANGQHSEDLSAVLSIHASLIFTRKTNPHSMYSLACFAL
jgi:hypothetical protein